MLAVAGSVGSSVDTLNRQNLLKIYYSLKMLGFVHAAYCNQSKPLQCLLY